MQLMVPRVVWNIPTRIQAPVQGPAVLLWNIFLLSLVSACYGCGTQPAANYQANNDSNPTASDQKTCGLPSDAESFPNLNLEQDWPWWRGPGRDGHAVPSANPPTKLDTENPKWKVNVPGRGHSSPIVIGNQVFLLTAFEDTERHVVLAFDRETGQELWQTEINRGGFPANNHPKNTEASPTLASDGQNVYTAVYHHDKLELFALDFSGQIVWQADLGRYRPRQYEYGYAASPVLYRDLVIVVAEYDGPSSLQALRRSDGKPAWKTPRTANISFSSPTIAHLQGKDQLLLSGGQKVMAYDPNSGTQLWEAPGTATATCGTAVWDGQRVFASGGYPQNETVAIELGPQTQSPMESESKMLRTIDDRDRRLPLRPDRRGNPLLLASHGREGNVEATLPRPGQCITGLCGRPSVLRQ